MRTGKETRPGVELIAEIDYSKIQISTSLSTMSCPSCTFEISCRTQELTNEIIDNHQHRRHTSVRDQCQVEGVQDEYDEIIGIISTIDIGEEPAKDETKEVQVQNDDFW